MQVDQRVGVPGAVRGLVEAHGPAARPLAGFADPAGGQPDVGLRDAGDPGDPVGRVVPQEGRHVLPALGVLGDEGGVGPATLDQEVQQAVEEGQIGARPDLQEQIGLVGGGVAPGVDHDELGAGGLDAVHHPQEEDGMAVGHVGADDEEGVRPVEVLVRSGRSVGTERELVAAAGARHAQARIGFDLVRPQEALGQLVRQVLGLQGHLAGDVQRQRVGTVRVEDRPQTPGRLGDGRLHRGGSGPGAPLAADQRGGQPAGRGQHVGVRRALGAQAPGVRRVPLVAGGLGHRTAPVAARGDVQDDPAPDAAVGAHRTHLLSGRGLRPRLPSATADLLAPPADTVPLRAAAAVCRSVRLRSNVGSPCCAQVTGGGSRGYKRLRQDHHGR